MAKVDKNETANSCVFMSLVQQYMKKKLDFRLCIYNFFLYMANHFFILFFISFIFMWLLFFFYFNFCCHIPCNGTDGLNSSAEKYKQIKFI